MLERIHLEKCILSGTLILSENITNSNSPLTLTKITKKLMQTTKERGRYNHNVVFLMCLLNKEENRMAIKKLADDKYKINVYIGANASRFVQYVSTKKEAEIIEAEAKLAKKKGEVK